MLVFKLSIKFRLELGVVVQACNPSTQAAEAGGLECSSLATLGYMKLCLQKEGKRKGGRTQMIRPFETQFTVCLMGSQAVQVLF